MCGECKFGNRYWRSYESCIFGLSMVEGSFHMFHDFFSMFMVVEFDD